MRLTDKLENLSSVPFHMPGHKRKSKFNLPSADIDITEIDGFDNLHNPNGVLLELENDITSLFESKKSFISVNGSTGGILSAISAVSKSGDKIIIARNCHKSVYNACFINRLDVRYIEPEFDEKFGIYTRVTQEAVDEAVRAYPDACAVVITSPTYEGIVSKINCPIPLIVDSAHGAHFGFAEWLPERAVGDIVVQSLHKTLPCLTQCAVVHINNEKYINSVKKHLDIFETSSPSYILLESIDKCVDILKSRKKLFEEYRKNLFSFYSELEKIEGISHLKNDDLTRIVISADGYTGSELMQILRDFGIEAESASLSYVILISSVADERTDFDSLIYSLKSIKKRSKKDFSVSKISLPEKAFNSFEIEDTLPCLFEEGVGKVCGEYIFAYPPGCPIIAPGEIITREIYEYIKKLYDKGINILSDSDLLPSRILTKR